MAQAANHFLAFAERSKRQGRHPFEDEERFKWFYTPVERRAWIREMTPPQKELAQHCCRGLSQQGYMKAVTIMSWKSSQILEKERRGARSEKVSDQYFRRTFGYRQLGLSRGGITSARLHHRNGR